MSTIDPSEAPEGYVAVPALRYSTTRTGCEGCAFEDDESCPGNCYPSRRKDRRDAIYVRQERL